jgi:hypothetical protein
MIVYIVLHGEQHEGGSVVSVHVTRKSAVDTALKQKCCFAGGWTEREDHLWENGCDFVQVLRFRVEE